MCTGVSPCYQVWMGGTANLLNLADTYAEKVKTDDLETFFEPIFAKFKAEKASDEKFGDWVNRAGFESIRAFQDGYTGLPAAAAIAAPAAVAAPAAAVAAPAAAAAGRLPRVMIEREAFEVLQAGAYTRLLFSST